MDCALLPCQRARPAQDGDLLWQGHWDSTAAAQGGVEKEWLPHGQRGAAELPEEAVK